MQNKRVYKISEAKSRIRNYCAIQDRCEWDVRKKLAEWGVMKSIKDVLIAELINDQFIDEERYARSFCRGKFRIKKWGKKKIEFTLKQKKISTTCIQKGMDEIDEQEYLLQLRTQAEKKNKLIKEKNHLIRKRKLAKHLVEKGYETHLVWQKIKEIYSK